MSDNQLLTVKNLHVNVEDKEILHGVDLSIGTGETHVLMGPNGTGKSTLGYALMGNPLMLRISLRIDGKCFLLMRGILLRIEVVCLFVVFYCACFALL